MDKLREMAEKAYRKWYDNECPGTIHDVIIAVAQAHAAERIEADRVEVLDLCHEAHHDHEQLRAERDRLAAEVEQQTKWHVYWKTAHETDCGDLTSIMLERDDLRRQLDIIAGPESWKAECNRLQKQLEEARDEIEARKVNLREHDESHRTIIADRDAEIERLRKALTEFAERGCKHDLTPTKSMGLIRTPSVTVEMWQTWSLENETWWHDWIKSMDSHVRERARELLNGGEPHEPFGHQMQNRQDAAKLESILAEHDNDLVTLNHVRDVCREVAAELQKKAKRWDGHTMMNTVGNAIDKLTDAANGNSADRCERNQAKTLTANGTETKTEQHAINCERRTKGICLCNAPPRIQPQPVSAPEAKTDAAVCAETAKGQAPPSEMVRALCDDNTRLEQERDAARAESEKLRAELGKLLEENDHLQRCLDVSRAENKHLRSQLHGITAVLGWKQLGVP